VGLEVALETVGEDMDPDGSGALPVRVMAREALLEPCCGAMSHLLMSLEGLSSALDAQDAAYENARDTVSACATRRHREELTAFKSRTGKLVAAVKVEVREEGRRAGADATRESQVQFLARLREECQGALRQAEKRCLERVRSGFRCGLRGLLTALHQGRIAGLLHRWAVQCHRARLGQRERETVGFLSMVREQCRAAMAEAENEYQAGHASMYSLCV